MVQDIHSLSGNANDVIGSELMAMEDLAVIVADMIRSALAWEKEHGVPPQNGSQNETYKAFPPIVVLDTGKRTQRRKTK
jgi:hypothetical protein